MSLNDTILSHCVELWCPGCRHEIRLARCSVDVDADALGRVRCPACGRPIENPTNVCRVNRSADDAEARDMARLDDMIAAAERDGETGYDGARADHSDLECMGGGADGAVSDPMSLLDGDPDRSVCDYCSQQEACAAGVEIVPGVKIPCCCYMERVA